MKSLFISAIAITAFIFSCSPSEEVNEICPEANDSTTILAPDSTVVDSTAKDSLK